MVLAIKVTRLRGMYDITPDEVWIWQRLEQIITDLLSQYGYQEIRFPILEKTQLFHSAIGEVTDVVEKEMFTFETRKGESISMRPEGTASTVRAVLQNGMIFNDPQKLWYMGPMFRYEKPQKGRNRQFSQIGVEVFGYQGPDVDAELLLLTQRMWQALGLQKVRLEINSLGTQACRQAYRDVLIQFFEAHVEVLDDDAKSRLYTNPLRILDSKNPAIQAIVKKAPQINDYLSEQAQAHFNGLCEMLSACGVDYQINRNLVRGLDYYSHNVFEWVTEDLGAQGTICAGGRYDQLVEMQGGKPTPATGFAIGVDRLVELVKDLDLWQRSPDVDVYLIRDKAVSVQLGLQFAEQLRSTVAGLRMLTHMGQGSFKSQFKKADKSGARFAIILGENEIQHGVVGIKSLFDRSLEQTTMSVDDVTNFLKQQVS